MTTRRRLSGPRALGHTVRRALRRLVDAYLTASAELAWAQAYGPGFAPTAPIRFSRPLTGPTYRVQPAGTPQPTGFRQPGRGRRQTPLSCSAAQASASA